MCHNIQFFSVFYLIPRYIYYFPTNIWNMSFSKRTVNISSFLSQMLHHPSPSPWDVDGRSPGWSRRNREDGDCEGHGAMFGEVCRCLQLLWPDGLPRSWPHLQRSVKQHLYIYIPCSTSGSKTLNASQWINIRLVSSLSFKDFPFRPCIASWHYPVITYQFWDWQTLCFQCRIICYSNVRPFLDTQIWYFVLVS